MSSGEAGVGWGVGGGGGEGAGVWASKCKPGVGSGEAGVGWGVGGGGGEGARGGGGTHSQPLILSHRGNASQVWVVARKCGPGGVRAVGVVRARGVVGTHWQPLNTL